MAILHQNSEPLKILKVLDFENISARRTRSNNIAKSIKCIFKIWSHYCLLVVKYKLKNQSNKK